MKFEEAMTQAAPRAPSPPPSECIAQPITLDGVSWSLYEELLAVVGEGLPRMTYDGATLEAAPAQPAAQPASKSFCFEVSPWMKRPGRGWSAIGCATISWPAERCGEKSDHDCI